MNLSSRSKAMGFCTNCGNRLTDECVFCPKCGCRVCQTQNTSASDFSETEGQKKCPNCGNGMPKDIFYCLECGCQFLPVRTSINMDMDYKSAVQRTGKLSGVWRNKWASFFLCVSLGWLGIHKFYEGKIVMGVLYLFTLGLLGIGWLADSVILLCKPNPYRAKR